VVAAGGPARSALCRRYASMAVRTMAPARTCRVARLEQQPLPEIAGCGAGRSQSRRRSRCRGFEHDARGRRALRGGLRPSRTSLRVPGRGGGTRGGAGAVVWRGALRRRAWRGVGIFSTCVRPAFDWLGQSREGTGEGARGTRRVASFFGVPARRAGVSLRRRAVREAWLARQTFALRRPLPRSLESKGALVARSGCSR
jgi:hypothetical protein